MSMSPLGRDNAHCIIVSIDRERAYWKDHYAALPRAHESRGFESYWPLLEQAYLVYLRHPDTSRDQGGELYAESKEARAWRLDRPQAKSLFSRVMDRIHRATTRLEFAA
jgi:hypothetical protein